METALKDVEVNILHVKLNFSRPTLYINIYKPPDISKVDFIDSLNKLLIELSNFHGKIIIAGDLNLNWNDSSNTTLLLKTLARQFNLTQLITQEQIANLRHV